VPPGLARKPFMAKLQSSIEAATAALVTEGEAAKSSNKYKKRTFD